MQHYIVIIICQNLEGIFFIVIINTNLIKQRIQCKIFYNIFNYGSNKVREIAVAVILGACYLVKR